MIEDSMEDTPKNILDILDDDCIDEIFRRVDNMADLMSMAEVCRRLRICAEQHYRIKYASKNETSEINQNNQRFARSGFNPLIISEEHLHSHSVHYNQAVGFFQLFGSITKNVVLYRTADQELTDTIFGSVVKNCARTLKALTLYNVPASSHYDPNFNFEEAPFELEHLFTSNSVPKNFSSKSTNFLKEITVNWQRDDEMELWFMRKMPNLKAFHLGGKWISFDIVSDFLFLNPQLEILVLHNLFFWNVEILNAITICRNLIKLDILLITDDLTVDVYNVSLRNLSLMKNLKILKIRLRQGWIRNLFDLFADNDIPIEDLWIQFYRVRNVHAPACICLKSLKTLKRLELSGDFSRSTNGFEHVVKTQTALETFQIDTGIGGDFSITSLERMLKCGHNLKEIILNIHKLWGNVDDFERALFYARKNRVRVQITGRNIDIPVNVMNENREWIDIIIKR